jgi:molybdenum cofactor synthesis domain-containing protein
MTETIGTKRFECAEILCVGTELLLGDIVNTNAAYLSRELAALGIPVYRQTVVGDNPERLSRALSDAFQKADLVITSGGLGPTYDDLTKETVAAYFGRRLVLHEESLERCRAYFARTNRVMPENNVKQAMIPEGATVFPNDYGTAPAVAVSDPETGKTVVMLPGPPRELEPIFRERVKPYLLLRSGEVLLSKNIHLFGIGDGVEGQTVDDPLLRLVHDEVDAGIEPREQHAARLESFFECVDCGFAHGQENVRLIAIWALEILIADFDFAVCGAASHFKSVGWIPRDVLAVLHGYVRQDHACYEDALSSDS